MGPKQKNKTPTKQVYEDTKNHEQFSPIKVKESPSQGRQGNLTGSARKLKDGAADLHNLIMKWQALNIDGVNIVNEIANIKTEKILCHSEDTDQPINLLPESLLPLCDKLENLLKKMEKVKLRLSGLAEMAKGVAQLEHYNKSAASDTVMFQTWNVDRFATAFQEIAEMYDREFGLKKCISEHICHGKDRNTIMFYTAAWVHEPYIEANVKVLFESMLLETKHKT